MKESNNPIVAISTPPGEGAIAVIRCSGNGIIDIVSKVYSSKKKLTDTASNQTHVGFIINPETKEKIDMVMTTVFRAPKSYTGEDMVEISTHGGISVSQAVVNLLLDNGCKYAARGEFTRRAFINGKMNLVQVEAVNDLIRARTSEQRKTALFGMEKGSAKPILKIKQDIESWLMKIEASIEFSEEDDVDSINMKKLKNDLNEKMSELDELINSFDSAKKIREGLLVPIAGYPNTGKSSLFNLLCKNERVIVDAEAGTTRDAVEEELDICGYKVRLVDTAGIRETSNRIEAKGIEITKKLLEEADIILWVMDINSKSNPDKNELLKKYKNSENIFIYNKTDLLDIKNREDGLYVSILNNNGTEELISSFEEKIKSIAGNSKKSIITSIVLRDCVMEAKKDTAQLLSLLQEGENREEIISEHLNDILESLEPLTGKIENAELMNRIFSQFCIGK